VTIDAAAMSVGTSAGIPSMYTSSFLWLSGRAADAGRLRMEATGWNRKMSGMTAIVTSM
jgi:hypothetical protein